MGWLGFAWVLGDDAAWAAVFVWAGTNLGGLVNVYQVSGNDVAWGHTWGGLVGFNPGLGMVDGICAGGDEPGRNLVSFHPVSGGDMARGQTWAGLVGFYLGLGTVDGIRVGTNEGSGRFWW